MMGYSRRLVAEGANIPLTAEAEAALAARGVLVLPDFIANAGGVICAAVEFRGGTESAALALIDEKIRANTEAVLNELKRTGALPHGPRGYEIVVFTLRGSRSVARPFHDGLFIFELLT